MSKRVTKKELKAALQTEVYLNSQLTASLEGLAVKCDQLTAKVTALEAAKNDLVSTFRRSADLTMLVSSLEGELASRDLIIKELETKVKQKEFIKGTLDTTYDQMLEQRNRLLDEIPPCPAHGRCVPHATEWIRRVRTLADIITGKATETREVDFTGALTS